MKCCTKKCCSTCGIIGGVILTLFAGLVYVISNPILASELQVELIVDSPEALRYYDWACKFTAPGATHCDTPYFAVPFYESYYFLNISNLDAVLQGEKPKLEEFGPYTYRVNITRYDITFLEDGTQVSYSEAHMYLFNEERSCEGCKPSDTFTLINAGYLGAIDTAINELGLTLGMTGPMIDSVSKRIRDTYIATKVSELGEAQVIADCTAALRDGEQCVTLDDAALVQWSSYFADNRRFVGLYDEEVYYYYDGQSAEFPYPNAELSAFADKEGALPGGEMSLNTVKSLLYGPYGIVVDPLHLLDLVANARDDEYLGEHWNMTSTQVNVLVRYLTNGTIVNSTDVMFAIQMADTRLGASEYSADIVRECIAAGGGLFATRNVHEWIYDYADPLLQLLQPGDPQTGIRTNDSSVEAARQYKGISKIYTGKGNFTDIANYIWWNSTDTVNYWEEPIPVYGNNQDGQFHVIPPDNLGNFPDILPDYVIWSPDHGRTVLLKDTGIIVHTDPGDIPVHRFALDNDTYKIDPFYSQYIEGYIFAGHFHMDPPFRHRLVFGAIAPLYMSQPRGWLVDPAYADKVEYVNVQPNFDDCATIVDIEPLSGNAMGAWKRLQVNFHVNSTKMALYDYQNVIDDIYFPQLYISQFAGITQELADDWNYSLGILMKIRDGFFIAGLVTGPILIVLFGILLSKSKKNDYQAIN